MGLLNLTFAARGSGYGPMAFVHVTSYFGEFFFQIILQNLFPTHKTLTNSDLKFTYWCIIQGIVL